MPRPLPPSHARKYSVGALLVNRPAGRFILRFGGAESKGCAPARHGVSISADMVVGVAPAATNFSWAPLTRLTIGFFALVPIIHTQPILECGGLPPPCMARGSPRVPLPPTLNLSLRQQGHGMPCPPSPRHARKYSAGALLVNRPAGRFILRFGGAESKGCAPACPGANISADMVVGA